jgi:hypothetical protein
VTTLEYLGALNDAADLEKGLGDPRLATRYQDRAAHVRSGIYDKCWSDSRGLLADNPDQKNFSQQANILAVLYDVIPKDRQQDVLRQMLAIEPAPPPMGSERLLLLPLLSRPRPGARRHGGRIPQLHRPLAQDAGPPLQHLA